QVGGRKAAAFERNERTQFRRNNRNNIKHHPRGLVQLNAVLVAECFDDTETLQHFLLLLDGGFRLQSGAEFNGDTFNIGTVQQTLDGVAADLGDKLAVIGIVEVLILIRKRGQYLVVLVFSEKIHALQTGHAGLNDDVRLVINDLLEVLATQTENAADLGRRGTEIPDMDNRNGKGDMSHAFTANRLLRHFDAAAVADNSLVPDPLVFAAMAFPVANRTEDLFAEQTVFFRTERSVVDRFRLGDFTMRPGKNQVGRSQRDRDLR